MKCCTQASCPFKRCPVAVHKMKILQQDDGIIIAYCVRCKIKEIVRIGDRKNYSRVFKRDTLQRHENVYYREYPLRMNVQR